MSVRVPVCISALIIAVVSLQSDSTPGRTASDGLPVSFSNRLLLHMAAVERRADIELMTVVPPQAWSRFEARLNELSAQIRFSDPRLGYARFSVPLAKVRLVATEPLVQAFHVATDAGGAWYRDGAASDALLFRRYEEHDTLLAQLDRNLHAPANQSLPELGVEQAAAPGYTGTEGTGLQELRARHPTFDGRGVTIALVESGAIQWDHPGFAHALTLDGTRVDKIAGVVFATDAEGPDYARVAMREIDAATTWHRVGNRTYILPAPGRYRFGRHEMVMKGNLSQTTAILWRLDSQSIWIDTDGDASFQNETPIVDVNREGAPFTSKIGFLALGPQRPPMALVMGTDIARSEAYVYFPPNEHSTQAASVAAAAPGSGSLASGMSPHARLLLVRYRGGGVPQFHNYIESLIRVAQRRDVDVISVSHHVAYDDVDTSRDLLGRVQQRIAQVYDKLVFASSSDVGPPLQNAAEGGGSLSIGSYVSPATFSAVVGAHAFPRTAAVPGSGFGPAMDGRLQPDFIAPMSLLAISVSHAPPFLLSRSRPAVLVPRGYTVSGGTSSASPAAAGLVATLISAAKQTGTRYSAVRLRRALYAGADVLDGVPHYAQGAGVINVARAWEALQANVEPVDIEFTAPIVDRMSRYTATPGAGVGLYEREGWRTGQKGRREIRVRRVSGPTGRVSYGLRWRGPTPVFTAPASVVLPLGEDVAVPIAIQAIGAGAHGSILEVYEKTSGAVVAWTACTIVVPVNSSSTKKAAEVRIEDTVAPMASQQHFVAVADGMGSLRVEFDAAGPYNYFRVVPPNHLAPERYAHLWSAPLVTRDGGRRMLQWQNPTPGVWSIAIQNHPDQYVRDTSSPRPAPTPYRVDVSTVGATLTLAESSEGDRVTATVAATGVEPRQLALRWAPARARIVENRFAADGVDVPIEIDVPDGTHSLYVRADSTGSEDVELYLYECTTGRCFSYDFTIPGARTQAITVRGPKSGRWQATINPAARWTATGGYRLQVVAVAQEPAGVAWDVGGARRSATRASIPRNPPIVPGPGEPAIYVEVIDPAAEARERTSPLIGSKAYQLLRTRPVPLATAIYNRQPGPSTHGSNGSSIVRRTRGGVLRKE